MGGVDKADQFLSYYGYNHRTLKWWKRGFFHLLDVAMVNAYILYTLSTQDHRLDHEHFRIAVAKDLIAQASVNVDAPPPPRLGRRSQALPTPLRLTRHHFVERIINSTTGKLSQLDCFVCSKRDRQHTSTSRRKTTSYKCKECNLPMCCPLFQTISHYTRL